MYFTKIYYVGSLFLNGKKIKKMSSQSCFYHVNSFFLKVENKC